MKSSEIELNKKFLKQATDVVKGCMTSAAKINEISLLLNQPEFREELLNFAHTLWDEAAILIVTLEKVKAKIDAEETVRSFASTPLDQKGNL
jgi:hypothetical protein